MDFLTFKVLEIEVRLNFMNFNLHIPVWSVLAAGSLWALWHYSSVIEGYIKTLI